MKKLMIVAAVAAMAGAAVAEEAVVDYVYDFTASVKSTGGKMGKKTTYTVKCGRNSKTSTANDAWWWNAAGYADDDEGKNAVKLMVENGDNDGLLQLAELIGFDRTTKKTEFNEKAQNGKYCCTFKFYDEGVCYRVAKSYKFKDTILFADCCGDTAVEAAYGTYTVNLLQRFGGMTYDKATKVEIDADVEGDLEGSNGGVDARFAGQGTFDKNGYIKSISGNIAGLQAAPACVGCCGDDDPAIAFDCVADDEAAVADETLDTAISGTWSMKYNKKASAELNK